MCESLSQFCTVDFHLTVLSLKKRSIGNIFDSVSGKSYIPPETSVGVPCIFVHGFFCGWDTLC